MNGDMILRSVRGQGNIRKGSVQLEGSELPGCEGQHGGPPAEGTGEWKHLAQSRAQRAQEDRGPRGDGGRQGRVAGSSVCPGECPEVSLLSLARSSCWAPTCLLQGGDSGGLQMCLGLARCGLQRVRRGGSSSAGIGRVGQLARGGRWLAGVRSSARCRWSLGEAGSWRGIWLSCWRCMRAVGTRAQ